MKVENYIWIIAGLFEIVSALLGFFYSKYWLVLTILVGLNMFQYGFTGFCPLARLLKKIGVKE